MAVKTDKVPFEKALDMTGYSRYNLLLFMLCSSIIISMTFEIFSVSYLVPASACELQTSSTQQGLIACMPLVGTIATSHVWGYFADTRGRRKILFVSMTMTYIASTISAFAHHWIIFSLVKLVSSASVSGAYALSLTLLSECTPRAKRSILVLLTTSVNLVAMGVMAVITIPVLPMTFSYHIPFLGIHFNSWRVLDLIFAMPCAISMVGCFFAYESPKYLVSIGRDEEALEVMKGMYVMNTGKSADNYQVESLELDEGQSSSLHKGILASIVAQTVPMIKRPFLKHTILLSSLFVITFLTTNAIIVWLPFIVNAFMLSVVGGERQLTICEMIRFTANATAVEEVHDCSMNSSAMILVFAINMGLAIFNTIVSKFINVIGRKQLYIGIQFTAGISGLVINFSPFWILSAVLLMVFLSGVFNFGFLNTFSVDIFPTAVRAMAVCLTLMFGRGSAVIGINVLKRLLDTNCESAFYIFGAIAFSGGLVGLLLPTDEKIRKMKEKIKDLSI